MIRYVDNEAIDRQKWDECITGAINPVIYAQSWLLDLTHPGWDALVLDDYQAGMPLTWRRKYFVHYLFTPFFIQQLGVVSRIPPDPFIMEEFLAAIPRRYRFSDINLNYANDFVPETGSLWWYTNLYVRLNRPYELIRQRYSMNTLRNLRKASMAGLEIREPVDPLWIISLFRENKGREVVAPYRKADYERLEAIMHYAMDSGYGFTLGTALPGKEPCTAAFFLQGCGRIVFLFSGNNPEGLQHSAMFLLIDHAIKKYSGQPMLFDFEGSNDPDLARFYRGFGASEERYATWKMNRLPWFGKIASDIRRRMKNII